MAKAVDFKYAPMFQVGEDKTEYRLLTKEGVTTAWLAALGYALLARRVGLTYMQSTSWEMLGW